MRLWKYTSASGDTTAAFQFAKDFLQARNYEDYYSYAVDPGSKKIASDIEKAWKPNRLERMADRCHDGGQDYITLGDSVTSATDIDSIVCQGYDDKWRSIWKASDYCTWTEWLIWNRGKHSNSAMPEVTSDFHMHFISERRAGPLTQRALEEVYQRLSNNHTRYTAFMDTHVTFETSNLDPILANLLLGSDVPILGQARPDGYFSIFMTIPHGPNVEITSLHCTLATVSASDDPCGQPTLLSNIDWDSVQLYKDPEHVKKLRQIWDKSQQEDWRFNRMLGKKVPPEWPQLRVTRVSFASTKPAAAATLVSGLLEGEVPSATIDTANTVPGCVETHSIQLSDQTGESFELAWVHRPADKQGTASLALLEQYALEIRGDFSERSWRNWEHLMDYHVGVSHQQCKPMISRLKANSVGFFIGEQGSHNELFVSIFFQDATGLVYEVVCLDQLSQADFCESFSSPEFYYASCCLDPNAFNNTQSLRLTSQANRLQELAWMNASPTAGNRDVNLKWCLYTLLSLALVALVFVIIRQLQIKRSARLIQRLVRWIIGGSLISAMLLILVNRLYVSEQQHQQGTLDVEQIQQQLMLSGFEQNSMKLQKEQNSERHKRARAARESIVVSARRSTTAPPSQGAAIAAPNESNVGSEGRPLGDARAGSQSSTRRRRQSIKQREASRKPATKK